MPMSFVMMEGITQEGLIDEIKNTVRKIIGPIAKPDEVQVVTVVCPRHDQEK